jgi:hypothetical protein
MREPGRHPNIGVEQYFPFLEPFRTVDRLALLVDLVDKWSDLSIFRLLHERITLPTTFNTK